MGAGHNKQVVQPVVRPRQYRSRCKWWLEQQELSAWRSPPHLSTRVFVLRPYTKFEVRGLYRSEDMANFRSRDFFPFGDLQSLTFDILILELVCNVTGVTDNCQFGCFCECRVTGKRKRVKITTWRYNLDLWPFDL